MNLDFHAIRATYSNIRNSDGELVCELLSVIERLERALMVACQGVAAMRVEGDTMSRSLERMTASHARAVAERDEAWASVEALRSAMDPAAAHKSE